MRELLMQRLDPEMKEGTILEWLKNEGDAVQKGEPIVKVEGEKTIFEIEAPESCILARILVEERSSAPVGEPIAILTQPDEELSETWRKVKEDEVKREDRLIVKASLAARKLAKTHNVDLTNIKGSGPEGRIVREDVLRIIQKKSGIALPRVEKVVPLVGMRKTIAERLTYSYRETPHVAITMEVDMSEGIRLRQTIEKMKNTKIPLTAFLTKVVAHALKYHPVLNATLSKDQIRIFKDINIGIAVDLEEGLIVPVVHDANKKNLMEIASLVENLIKKAKERSLTTEELKNGTFTITNLGAFGVDIFMPIINPPQTAILGIGRIAKKPRVVDEQIKVLPVATLNLVFDHRIIDGAKAAKFLQDVRKLLEEPNILFAGPL